MTHTATEKLYRFSVELPWYKQASVVALGKSARDARGDAYSAVYQEAGGLIGRITTSAEDAKAVRKLPQDAEPFRDCYTVLDDGTRKYWAWLIVEKM